ncbi:MAG TPA: amidase family protein, partial [Magnetospirillum sp.]|nr:amidase family protein [Magnetospirillum sp.]
MTELTKLTIADALDSLGKGEFTSVELTEAHLKAMAAKRGLNAYITETPELALEEAKASDARRAAGKAGALDGIPLGIKDLFCTKGVLTT